ncbi:MAG TPA: transposase [Terriglobales bacterium]|jgi:putative transposase|nr:transposase [Terriglobales bacterium]
MSKPPRYPAENVVLHTFFVTASAWQGRRLLQSERSARLLIDVLYDYRRQGVYRLHEFTVMPNHFHALFTVFPDFSVAQAMQRIKGGFSYRAGKEFGKHLEIWQRSFTDHAIGDAVDYARHRDYIRNNAVAERIVFEAEQFPFCSAHPGFELDEAPEEFRGLKPAVGITKKAG